MRRGMRAALSVVSISALAAGLALGWQKAPSPPQAPLPPAKVEFNKDVRPILAEHCWPCHGMDKAALERTGGLKLDSYAEIVKDRDGVRSLTPGSPANSEMWLRINHADESLRMPPAVPTVKPLDAAKKRIIWQWIRQGGQFQEHWAFIPPRFTAPPKVNDTSWPKDDIDRFVLAAMEKQGLQPAEEVDRIKLFRRASLTLTGLPPTPIEVENFVKDTRPDAYERAVDRLLASPRYGEHQARFWMDAVRYADTHGLHIDNERAVHPYRDWVVRAFNQDLPFNDFTKWQLAGDLLPNPTLDQMIATGYVRMNPTTAEGGVIEAEFLAKNTYDRVDTTSTIFMGLTTACAKCHDHKYDPITQKDYFSLYAFFNSTTDPVLDGNLKLHQPVMKAPDPEQARAFARSQAKLKALEDAADSASASQWAMARATGLPAKFVWEKAGPFSAKSFDEAFDTDYKPTEWKAQDFGLDRAVALVGKENSAAYLRTKWVSDRDIELEMQLGSDDGIEVWLNGASVHKLKAARGLTVNQDKVPLKVRKGENELVFKLTNGGGGDALQVNLGDARSRRIDNAAALAAKPSRTSDEEREIRATFLEYGSAKDDYRNAVASHRKLDEEIPFTYIVREMEKPRETFILKRGEYNLPGDRVDREIPAIFGTLPKNAPKNRLGLAEWLVDPRNPLVARVFVNRIWQQHFGTGIVKSSEDFGNRGDWPSHPELLDHLAIRFVRSGWSVKELHRMIVTSATFRQDAAADAAKRAKDPENKWLARGPRFRLDAEVIRDSALLASGLLVEKRGGRGVKPYQPAGLWEAIAYPISDTARYVQDKGENLYRRSLYLFWKRTSPPPTMLIFDAPMRESCTVKRSRTNTPSQALATMNDPQFVEAARVMAQRILSVKANDEERASYAFQLATSRRPNASELEVLMDALGKQRAVFREKPEQAKKFISIGEFPTDPNIDPSEHAAWTLLCNLVLNLDEALTQH